MSSRRKSAAKPNGSKTKSKGRDRSRTVTGAPPADTKKKGKKGGKKKTTEEKADAEPEFDPFAQNAIQRGASLTNDQIVAMSSQEDSSAPSLQRLPSMSKRKGGVAYRQGKGFKQSSEAYSRNPSAIDRMNRRSKVQLSLKGEVNLDEFMNESNGAAEEAAASTSSRPSSRPTSARGKRPGKKDAADGSNLWESALLFAREQARQRLLRHRDKLEKLKSDALDSEEAEVTQHTLLQKRLKQVISKSNQEAQSLQKKLKEKEDEVLDETLFNREAVATQLQVMLDHVAAQAVNSMVTSGKPLSTEVEAEEQVHGSRMSDLKDSIAMTATLTPEEQEKQRKELESESQRLQGELRGVQDDLRQRTEEFESLKGEKSRLEEWLNGKLREYEDLEALKDTDVKKFNETISTMTSDLSKKNEDLARVTANLSRVQLEMDEKDTKASQLLSRLQEIDLLQFQIKELQAALAGSREAYQSMEAEKDREIGQMKSNMRDMSAVAAANSAELQKERLDKENLEKDVKAAEGKLKAVEKLLASKEAERLKYKEAVKSKEAELKGAKGASKEELKKISSDLETARAQLSAKDKEMVRWRERRDEMDSVRANLESKLNRLETAHTELRSKSDAELAAMSAELEELREVDAKLTAARSRLVAKDNEIEDLLSRERSLMDDLTQLRSELNEKEESHSTALLAIQAGSRGLEVDVSDLKQKVTELEANLQSADKEKTELRENLTKVERDVETLTAEKASVEQDLETIKQQHSTEMEELRSKLDAQTSSYEEQRKSLETALEEQKATVAKLEEEQSTELEKVNAELTTLRAELDSKTSEYEAQRKTLEDELQNQKEALQQAESSGATGLSEATALVATLRAQLESDGVKHEEERKALESSLEEQREAVSKLEAENASRITEMETQLDALTSELESTKTAHEEQRSALEAEVEQHKATALAAQSEADTRSSELAAEVASLQTQLDEKVSESEEARKLLEARLQEQEEAAAKAQEEATARSEDISAQLAALEAKKQELEARVQKAESEAESERHRVEDIQSELSAKEADFHAMEEHRVQTESSFKEKEKALRNEVQSLRAELEEKTGNIAVELEATTAAKVALAAQVAALTASIAQEEEKYTTEVSRLEKELAAVEETKSALERNLEEKEAQVTTLEEDLRRTRTEDRAKLYDREAQLHVREAEVEQFRTALAEKEEEATALQIRLDEIDMIHHTQEDHMRGELQMTEENLRAAEDEVEQLTAKVSEVEKELRETTVLMQAASTQLTAKKEEVVTLQAEKEKLSRKLTDVQVQILNLEKQVSEQTFAVDDLKEQLEEKSAALQQVETELATEKEGNQTKLSALQVELAAAVAASAALQSEMSTENEKHKAKLSAVQSELEASLEQVKEAEVALSVEKDIVASLTEEQTRLKASVAEAVQEYTEAVKKLEQSLETVNEELVSKQKELKALRSTTAEEKQVLSNSISSLEEEKQKLSEEAEQLRSDLEAAKEQKEKEVASVNEKLAVVTTSLEAKESEVAKLQLDLSHSQEALSTAEEAKKELQSSLDSALSRSSEEEARLRSSLTALEAKVHEKDTQIVSLEESLGVANEMHSQELDRVREEKRSVQSSLEEAEQQLGIARAETEALASLRAELEDQKRVVSSQESDIADLEARLTDSQDALDSIHADTTSLQEQHAQEIEALKQQLEEASKAATAAEEENNEGDGAKTLGFGAGFLGVAAASAVSLFNTPPTQETKSSEVEELKEKAAIEANDEDEDEDETTSTMSGELTRANSEAHMEVTEVTVKKEEEEVVTASPEKESPKEESAAGAPGAQRRESGREPGRRAFSVIQAAPGAMVAGTAVAALSRKTEKEMKDLRREVRNLQAKLRSRKASEESVRLRLEKKLAEERDLRHNIEAVLMKERQKVSSRSNKSGAGAAAASSAPRRKRGVDVPVTSKGGVSIVAAGASSGSQEERKPLREKLERANRRLEESETQLFALRKELHQAERALSLSQKSAKSDSGASDASETLKATVERRRAAVSSQETRVKNMTKLRRDILDQEKEELRSDAHVLKRKLRDVEKALKHKAHDQQTLEKRVAAKELELTALKEKVEQSGASTNEAKRLQLAHATAEVTSLRKKLKARGKELQFLENSEKKLQLRNKKLAAQQIAVDDVSEKLQSLDAPIHSKEIEISRLQLELERVQGQKDSLSNQAGASEERVRALEATMETLSLQAEAALREKEQLLQQRDTATVTMATEVDGQSGGANDPELLVDLVPYTPSASPVESPQESPRGPMSPTSVIPTADAAFLKVSNDERREADNPLADRLREVMLSMEQLQSERSEMVQRLQSKEAYLSQLERQQKDNDQAGQQSDETISRLRVDMSEAHSELRKAKEELLRLQSVKMAAVSSQKQQLELEQQELDSELSEVDEALKEHEEDAAFLENKLYRKQEDLEEMRRQLDSQMNVDPADEERERLALDAVSRLKSRLAHKRGEVSSIRGLRSLLALKREEKKEDVKRLDTLSDRMERHHLAVVAEESRLNELTGEMEEMDSEDGPGGISSDLLARMMAAEAHAAEMWNEASQEDQRVLIDIAEDIRQKDVEQSILDASQPPPLPPFPSSYAESSTSQRYTSGRRQSVSSLGLKEAFGASAMADDMHRIQLDARAKEQEIADLRRQLAAQTALVESAEQASTSAPAAVAVKTKKKKQSEAGGAVSGLVDEAEAEEVEEEEDGDDDDDDATEELLMDLAALVAAEEAHLRNMEEEKSSIVRHQKELSSLAVTPLDVMERQDEAAHLLSLSQAESAVLRKELAVAKAELERVSSSNPEVASEEKNERESSDDTASPLTIAGDESHAKELLHQISSLQSKLSASESRVAVLRDVQRDLTEREAELQQRNEWVDALQASEGAMRSMVAAKSTELSTLRSRLEAARAEQAKSVPTSTSTAEISSPSRDGDQSVAGTAAVVAAAAVASVATTQRVRELEASVERTEGELEAWRDRLASAEISSLKENLAQRERELQTVHRERASTIRQMQEEERRLRSQTAELRKALEVKVASHSDLPLAPSSHSTIVDEEASVSQSAEEDVVATSPTVDPAPVLTVAPESSSQLRLKEQLQQLQRVVTQKEQDRIALADELERLRHSTSVSPSGLIAGSSEERVEDERVRELEGLLAVKDEECLGWQRNVDELKRVVKANEEVLKKERELEALRAANDSSIAQAEAALSVLEARSVAGSKKVAVTSKPVGADGVEQEENAESVTAVMVGGASSSSSKAQKELDHSLLRDVKTALVAEKKASEDHFHQKQALEALQQENATLRERIQQLKTVSTSSLGAAARKDPATEAMLESLRLAAETSTREVDHMRALLAESEKERQQAVDLSSVLGQKLQGLYESISLAKESKAQLEARLQSREALLAEVQGKITDESGNKEDSSFIISQLHEEIDALRHRLVDKERQKDSVRNLSTALTTMAVLEEEKVAVEEEQKKTSEERYHTQVFIGQAESALDRLRMNKEAVAPRSSRDSTQTSRGEVNMSGGSFSSGGVVVEESFTPASISSPVVVEEEQPTRSEVEQWEAKLASAKDKLSQLDASEAALSQRRTSLDERAASTASVVRETSEELGTTPQERLKAVADVLQTIQDDDKVAALSKHVPQEPEAETAQPVKEKKTPAVASSEVLAMQQLYTTLQQAAVEPSSASSNVVSTSILAGAESAPVAVPRSEILSSHLEKVDDTVQRKQRETEVLKDRVSAKTRNVIALQERQADARDKGDVEAASEDKVLLDTMTKELVAVRAALREKEKELNLWKDNQKQLSGAIRDIKKEEEVDAEKQKEKSEKMNRVVETLQLLKESTPSADHSLLSQIETEVKEERTSASRPPRGNKLSEASNTAPVVRLTPSQRAAILRSEELQILNAKRSALEHDISLLELQLENAPLAASAAAVGAEKEEEVKDGEERKQRQQPQGDDSNEAALVAAQTAEKKRVLAALDEQVALKQSQLAVLEAVIGQEIGRDGLPKPVTPRHPQVYPYHAADNLPFAPSGKQMDSGDDVEDEEDNGDAEPGSVTTDQGKAGVGKLAADGVSRRSSSTGVHMAVGSDPEIPAPADPTIYPYHAADTLSPTPVVPATASATTVTAHVPVTSRVAPEEEKAIPTDSRNYHDTRSNSLLVAIPKSLDENVAAAGGAEPGLTAAEAEARQYPYHEAVSLDASSVPVIIPGSDAEEEKERDRSSTVSSVAIPGLGDLEAVRNKVEDAPARSGELSERSYHAQHGHGSSSSLEMKQAVSVPTPALVPVVEAVPAGTYPYYEPEAVPTAPSVSDTATSLLQQVAKLRERNRQLEEASRHQEEVRAEALGSHSDEKVDPSTAATAAVLGATGMALLASDVVQATRVENNLDLVMETKMGIMRRELELLRSQLELRDARIAQLETSSSSEQRKEEEEKIQGDNEIRFKSSESSEEKKERATSPRGEGYSQDDDEEDETDDEEEEKAPERPEKPTLPSAPELPARSVRKRAPERPPRPSMDTLENTAGLLTIGAEGEVTREGSNSVVQAGEKKDGPGLAARAVELERQVSSLKTLLSKQSEEMARLKGHNEVLERKDPRRAEYMDMLREREKEIDAKEKMIDDEIQRAIEEEQKYHSEDVAAMELDYQHEVDALNSEVRELRSQLAEAANLLQGAGQAGQDLFPQGDSLASELAALDPEYKTPEEWRAAVSSIQAQLEQVQKEKEAALAAASAASAAAADGLSAADQKSQEDQLHRQATKLSELETRISTLQDTLQSKEEENHSLQAEALRKEHEISNLMWRVKDMQRQLYQKKGGKERGRGCYGYRCD